MQTMVRIGLAPFVRVVATLAMELSWFLHVQSEPGAVVPGDPPYLDGQPGQVQVQRRGSLIQMDAERHEVSGAAPVADRAELVVPATLREAGGVVRASFQDVHSSTPLKRR